MTTVLRLSLWSLLGALLWSGCDSTGDMLAPYEGQRPLTLLAVTESATPDVQWVGGRVAAVGVNRGPAAALDETLVWITRADANAINSFVTVGEGSDEAFVESLGGTPLDSLIDGEVYTVWLAERDVLDQGLADPDSMAFCDTTFTLSLGLQGRSGGDPDLDLDITMTLDQRLLAGEKYVISWTPSDVPVRRIALRQASSGGFTELVWHVALPDSEPDGIYPPVILGEPPPGATEAVPWTEFEAGVYTLWMVTSDWTAGDFGPRDEGYAFFQIFSSNFE